MLMNWSKRLRNFELNEESVKNLQRVNSLCWHSETCRYNFDDYMNLVIKLGCKYLELIHKDDVLSMSEFMVSEGVELEDVASISGCDGCSGGHCEEH